MPTDEPGPELSEADLARLMAERGLDLAPSDRQPILAIARFLQGAAARVARAESDADEGPS